MIYVIIGALAAALIFQELQVREDDKVRDHNMRIIMDYLQILKQNKIKGA